MRRQAEPNRCRAMHMWRCIHSVTFSNWQDMCVFHSALSLYASTCSVVCFWSILRCKVSGEDWSRFLLNKLLVLHDVGFVLGLLFNLCAVHPKTSYILSMYFAFKCNLIVLWSLIHTKAALTSYEQLLNRCSS